MSKREVSGDQSGVSPVTLGWLSSIGVTAIVATVFAVAYIRTSGTEECPETYWWTVTACPWWDEFVYTAMVIGSVGTVVLVPILLLVVLGREIYR